MSIIHRPPQQPPSSARSLGWSALAGVGELIAAVAGFASAATQNWTAAWISGSVAVIIGTFFLLICAPRLSRWMVVAATLPTLVGSGLVGAAIGHAITPTTVVSDDKPGPNPEPPTSSTVTSTTTNTTSSTSPSSSSTTPSTSASETTGSGDRQFLSELRPLNTNAVDSPDVVTIGTETYPNSFSLGCDKGGSSVTYRTAGYRLLESKLGLDNNQSGAAAERGYKSVIRVNASGGGPQLGPEYSVSLNNSADMSVPLNGAVQITITCTLIDPTGGNSGYYQVGFGNAVIIK